MRITEKQVLFWGDTDIYSNFYREKDFTFIHKLFKFHSSEQAFMWRKAMFFNDLETANMILNETKPYKCKKLGRVVKNYNDELWASIRYKIMVEVLIDKFSNPKLKEILLSTENREFVEASPFDNIWGVQLAEDDKRIEDKRNWKGLNLLGKALNEVKDYYKKN